MTKLTVALTNDEQNALYKIADQDLRLPEQVFRWLIRTEAAKRGLWTPLAANEEICTIQPIVANRPTPEHI